MMYKKLRARRDKLTAPARHLRHASCTCPLMAITFVRGQAMRALLLVLAVCANAQTIVQRQYVRGELYRVTTSSATPGGAENRRRSSYTPRVSGDGNTVVFKSDAALSTGGFEADNDYHVWRYAHRGDRRKCLLHAAPAV